MAFHDFAYIHYLSNCNSTDLDTFHVEGTIDRVFLLTLTVLEYWVMICIHTFNIGSIIMSSSISSIAPSIRNFHNMWYKQA